MKYQVNMLISVMVKIYEPQEIACAFDEDIFSPRKPIVTHLPVYHHTFAYGILLNRDSVSILK